MSGPSDPYAGMAPALESPYIGAFVVTPGSAFPTLPRALYVGGAGALALTMEDGSTVTLSAVPAGALLPVRASAVASSGTTATNIVGLY